MYGLIAAALSGNDTFAGPASRADVEQLLHQRRLEKSKHCIFFLDEFPRVHRTFVNSNHELRILAMLNVFRSFGLPVVISSTTGTARKACLLGGGSRVLSGDPLVPWCVMIPSLPSVVLSDENAANEMIPNQIKRILRHSRPLFVAITLYFVRSRSAQTDGWIGFMCEMIDFLAPIFRAIKQMRPDEFELGQLGLLFGGSYGVIEENRNFIDCHYARLREVEPLELALGEEGVLLHSGKTWVAECDFPPSEDDMLLHLALLAGKDNEEAKKFQPLSGPLLKLLDEPSAQTIFNLNSSSQQASLRITAACMVLASRRDGVRGVNFPEFLGGLLYHLCIRETLEAAELHRNWQSLDWIRGRCLIWHR